MFRVMTTFVLPIFEAKHTRKVWCVFNITTKINPQQLSFNRYLCQFYNPSQPRQNSLCPSVQHTLLKYAGEGKLYARDPRDGAIIYALNQKFDIWKTNEFLREMNLPEFALAD